MSAKLRSVHLLLLRQIAEAGPNGMFAPSNQTLKALEKEGAVEVNSAITDGKGGIAVRITDAGRSYLSGIDGDRENVQVDAAEDTTEAVGVEASDTEPQQTPKKEKESMSFEIVSEIPAEVLEAQSNQASPRRGPSEKYPFSKLEVGGGVYVPPTDKMPDPRKQLVSAVNSAQARFAEDTGEVETVTVREWARDAEGKRIKDEDGRYVQDGSYEEKRPVKQPTRRFKLLSDPRGGAWIMRTA